MRGAEVSGGRLNVELPLGRARSGHGPGTRELLTTWMTHRRVFRGGCQ
jgi:hypothetical protein